MHLLLCGMYRGTVHTSITVERGTYMYGTYISDCSAKVPTSTKNFTQLCTSCNQSHGPVYLYLTSLF